MATKTTRNRATASPSTKRISFSLSKELSWDTELEEKLRDLPYPELHEAFVTAITAATYPAWMEKSVPELMELAKPEDMDIVDISNLTSQASSLSPFFTPEELHSRTPDDLAVYGAVIAISAIRHLWLIEHAIRNGRLNQPADLISAIVNVCLLAEKAKHVVYSEERSNKWNHLIYSGRVLNSKNERKAGKKALDDAIDLSISGMWRWIKKNGPRHSNFTDLATEFMEVNLQMIPPAVIFGLLHQVCNQGTEK